MACQIFICMKITRLLGYTVQSKCIEHQRWSNHPWGFSSLLIGRIHGFVRALPAHWSEYISFSKNPTCWLVMAFHNKYCSPAFFIGRRGFYLKTYVLFILWGQGTHSDATRGYSEFSSGAAKGGGGGGVNDATDLFLPGQSDYFWNNVDITFKTF